MNTKDLTYFCTICQEKSITRAAKLLYLSPQGLSKIMKNIESELGVQLLIRTAKGITLTEAGECFYAGLPDILKSYDILCNDAIHISQRYNREIDLISAYGILRLITPDCLLDFREKHPDITLQYREYPDKQVERLFLHDREGNVAFSIGPFDETLYDITPIASFEIKLLVNKLHPLSTRKSVSIADLKEQPLYIESSEFSIYHMINEACRKHGFRPNIMFESSGFSLCHKLVSQNKGISVTVDFISADLARQNLVLIPFTDLEVRWEPCMLIRKSEETSDDILLFQRHIRKWLSSILHHQEAMI